MIFHKCEILIPSLEKEEIMCCLFTVNIRNYEGVPVMSMAADISKNTLGEYYNMVLPASCVITIGDDSYVFTVHSRNGLFGEERYVELTSVQILGGNSFFTAIASDSSITWVVAYSSQPLHNGINVRVER